VLEQTDTRLVCGWPSDPEPDVRNSRLRPDLYQRLSGISLILPPAEECRAESLKIARRFLFRASTPEEPSPENDAEALPRSWPGDARELQKTLASAMKHSL
jgi:DNA-binding NtrC family response regulator